MLREQHIKLLRQSIEYLIFYYVKLVESSVFFIVMVSVVVSLVISAGTMIMSSLTKIRINAAITTAIAFIDVFVSKKNRLFSILEKIGLIKTPINSNIADITIPKSCIPNVPRNIKNIETDQKTTVRRIFLYFMKQPLLIDTLFYHILVKNEIGLNIGG